MTCFCLGVYCHVDISTNITIGVATTIYITDSSTINLYVCTSVYIRSILQTIATTEYSSYLIATPNGDVGTRY